jgi:hypothetical protein
LRLGLVVSAETDYRFFFLTAFFAGFLAAAFFLAFMMSVLPL